MKKLELIKKVSKLYYPQELEKGWESSCPCFYYNPTVDGKRLTIHGHCWRTTDNGKDLMDIAKAFKKQLDKQKWYSKWDLEIVSKIV
jgi:hypothetical protein